MVEVTVRAELSVNDSVLRAASAAADDGRDGRRRRTLWLVLALASVQLLFWLAPPLPAARGISGYVPLHTLLETAAIVVAVLVSAIGWSAPDPQRPANFSLLAVVFGGVAVLDMLHTLSFKGMPAFITPASPEKAINFWLAARALAALGLLCAAMLPWRPWRGNGARLAWLLGTGASVATCAWLGLWHPEAVPRTFVEGVGLTPLKIGIEYLLIGAYAASAVLLWMNSGRRQPFDATGLFGAAAVMAMSELFFTLYADVADVFNLLGHVYKVIGYGFLCRSLFVDSVRDPFRRIAESNQALEASNRALAASEARFRDLTDLATDWYWETDADDRFTQLAGSAERAIVRMDAIGRRRWELPHSGIDEAGWQAHRAIIARREPFENLVYRVQPPGISVWCSVSGKPFYDADGRYLGYRGVGTDITARVRHQEALERMNQELERRVAERTAALAAARDEAERASRAKTAFLSSMSHELRTPLNAILGFGHMLATDSVQRLSPRQQAQVQHILGAGRHLLSLISEMLDLSRIEAGRLPVNCEPVALQPLLQECADLMRPLARAQSLTLDVGGAGQPPLHALADPVRLKQVLLNLLSNAIKFNRPGGRVDVTLASEGREVALTVSDTGVGLNAEQRQRLFMPFERMVADDSAIEGAGVGLALSHRLVGLMGGRFDVDSQPDLGSSFCVRLPACPAPVLAPAGPSTPTGPAPSASRPVANASRGVRTLLYVEDNPVNTMLMEALLEDRPDLRLLTAAHPLEAIEMVRRHRPDLLLLDIQLPGFDGCELLRRLREELDFGAPPAIAVTAGATSADVGRSAAAGFAAHVTKPLDVELLFKSIDRVLAAQPQGAVAP